MLTEKEKLTALAGLGAELNRVRDLDVLMEEILLRARLFVNADAGSIYIRDAEKLNFSYTQNETLEKDLAPGDRLIYSRFSIPIDQKSIAGFAAATGRTLNIGDVYALSPDLPYGFKKDFDQKTGYQTRSMLTTPLLDSRENSVGVLQVINRRDENGGITAFSDDDEMMMGHFAGIAAVALERAQMTRTLLLRMIQMAEMRDPKETGAHVNRVGAYSLELYGQWARRKGLSDKDIQADRDVIRMAAMLHDVGKVAISDTILKKPGRFEKDEYEIMKTHTVLGARLFQDRYSDFDEAARVVALNHHERWDGRGYPGHVDPETGMPLAGKTGPDGRALGKKGEEIPLFGRIVSLCDVYDALSSKRVYKKAWTEAETLAALKEGAGTQFDPELVELFLSRIPVMRAIQKHYKDEEPGE